MKTSIRMLSLLGIVLVALLGVLCLISVGSRAEAQAPSWTARSLDTSAFKYVIDVAPLDVPVPTVAEIVLPGSEVQYVHAVAVDPAGTGSGVLYRTTAVSVPLSVRAHNTVRNTEALFDSNITTYVNFPFSERTENKSTLIIDAPQSITTRELRLVLPANVALPYKVAVRGMTDRGTEEVLLASTRPTGTTVRFPETTVTRLDLELEYTQPLRIAELTVVPVVPGEVTRTLRFLAQPNTAYRVYLDTDHSLNAPTTALRGLESAERVVVLENTVIEENPGHVPADGDKDGVPDMYDNCVRHANLDQLDVDQNGRGDVCDDFDLDGVINTLDNCPDIPNRDQADTDGDEVGDLCDTEESRFTEANPWVPWVGMGIAALVLLVLFFVTARESRRKTVLGDTEAVCTDNNIDVQ